MDAKKAIELLDKYQAGTATNEEVSLIEKWVMLGKIQDFDLSDEELTSDLLLIRNRLPLKYNAKRRRLNPTTDLLRNKPLSILYIAATVAVMTLGIWLYNSYSTELLSSWFKSQSVSTKSSGAFIEPGKSKATLSFDDGKTIALSESKSGVVINQLKLKYDDQTEITSIADNGTTIRTLTVSTPRGGLYQITLSDGSKVWLNAASSVRFPASFEGVNQRTIELVGEAYFEVAKNPLQKFVVVTRARDGMPAQNIEVLGTQFNIQSYPEEKNVTTTLLTGSLKVNSPEEKSVVLVPGEETVLDRHGLDKRDANTDLAVAWRKGTFYFNKTPFDHMMRQLARWYNVDVVYQTRKMPDIRFSGEMKRDVTLQTLLTYLEDLGVKLEVEGRTLVIK